MQLKLVADQAKMQREKTKNWFISDLPMMVSFWGVKSDYFYISLKTIDNHLIRISQCPFILFLFRELPETSKEATHRFITL